MSNPRTPFDELWEEIGSVVNKALAKGVQPPSVVMILEMTKTEIAMEHISRARVQAQMQQAVAMAKESEKKIITPHSN
jgi:hypothetical protein